MGFKKTVSHIRDPIHDYIPYTVPVHPGDVAEKSIIDTKAFQRLRRILQLQSTFLVYPGAMHTRFQHSIGVMHLAGKFARMLYQSYKITQDNDDLPEEEYFVELFRLVGLLHDVGHGPFGHTLDEVYTYKKFGLTHEDIGKYIIKEILGELISKVRRSPGGTFETEIEPELVMNLIKPGAELKEDWQKSFANIIYGLYSVDKLDYLVRDSYFCGTPEFGIVDIERLLYATQVTKEGFVLDKNSVSVLKAFLWARFFMYENVYFHKTVRACDISFSQILGEVLELIELGNPIENIDAYLDIDDFSLTSRIIPWLKESGRKKEVAEEWVDLYWNRNIQWKLAYQKEVLFTRDNLGIFLDFKSVSDKLNKKFKEMLSKEIRFLIDMPFLDVRPENPYLIKENTGILFYDPISNTIDKTGSFNVYESIPSKFILIRVFADKKYLKKVNKVAKVIFEESEGLQITSY